jgi:DNA-binding HxlR family transcriptional regulator
MATMHDHALARALEQIGDRWSLLLIRALLSGPRRYNELATDVPGIAPNVLAARLRHLEGQRLLTSAPYQLRPKRLAYSLSESGQELATVLGALSSWGARQHGLADLRRHDECGATLQWRPWCPTCQRAVDLPAEPAGEAANQVERLVWM